MDDNVDKFRVKVQNGETCIGVYISFSDPAISELFAEIGYDFTWIDLEHAPIDINTALLHVMALRGAKTASFIRVQGNDPAFIKPVLDLNPAGIIFPMVCTAEEAEQAVKACKYPPGGMRGFCPRRGIQFGGTDIQAYLNEADNRTLVIIQVEHIDAVKNLDDILKVDGVDSICIGPMDLSGSLGILGQIDDPDYIKICDIVIEKVRKTDKMIGIAAGYKMTDNGENVRQLIEKGIQWICLNSDFVNLYTYSKIVYDSARAFDKGKK
jgi:2-keto-3-deoxy-L-rhamnonate aldolase RhmA